MEFSPIFKYPSIHLRIMKIASSFVHNMGRTSIRQFVSGHLSLLCVIYRGCSGKCWSIPQWRVWIIHLILISLETPFAAMYIGSYGSFEWWRG